jgi:hypothetical protein
MCRAADLHALRFDIPGPRALRVFVDPQDRRHRLCHGPLAPSLRMALLRGLHTFQLPGLVVRDALRKTIECLCLLLGAPVAATGVVLGINRLRQTVGEARGA